MTLARLVTGSHLHAARRWHQMSDGARSLEQMDVPRRMSRRAEAWFGELAGRREAAPASETRAAAMVSVQSSCLLARSAA